MAFVRFALPPLPMTLPPTRHRRHAAATTAASALPRFALPPSRCAPPPRFALPPPPLTLLLSRHCRHAAADVCCRHCCSLRAAATALLLSRSALPPHFVLPPPPLTLPLPPPPRRRHAATNVALALVDCYISVNFHLFLWRNWSLLAS
jgi:hypothetical protein